MADSYTAQDVADGVNNEGLDYWLTQYSAKIGRLEMAQKAAEYVPVGPVAKLLHVSPKTIARWSTEGYTSKKDGKVHVIPHGYTFGGHRRYSVLVANELAEELEIPERL